MVKAAAFVVPGDLATPTGGYAYDRRIIGELRALGWQMQVLDIGDSFPRPTVAARAAAQRRLAELPGGYPIVVDGLAFGVLAEEAQALAPAHRLVALVHHPLALESGLSAGDSAALHASERAALACARHVITTSPSTAQLLIADFAVPSQRLSIVRPGTDRAPAPARVPRPMVELLAVGSVVPRKGYDVLVAALAAIHDLAWRLVIAGDRARDPHTARLIDAEIERLGLGSRITFAGAVAPARLMQLYAAADLFVLSSRFEGYGMAYAEAIAHGLPVVGTRAGAVPDTVPAGAGVLVPPDDVDALALVLRRLIESPSERARLSAGARAAAATFPSWQDSASLFARVLEQVAEPVAGSIG
ncbi:MAG TPA: glycosyltransferase family 4 protein [Xanthobacteraceae bacterium]